MLLSIIVPVYNVEQYLAFCLRSLLNQDVSPKDYEIIVVNDGSPDNSLQIAEAFVSKNENIRIITRENGGLAAARNTGIEHANGDYLWFVDSDDYIEPNSIKRLLDKALDDDLDILCFNLKLKYDSGKIIEFGISAEKERGIYSGVDFVTKVGMPGSACIAFYKHEFLKSNNLRFMEGILHEDQEFTPRAYALASRISYISAPIYVYYQREGSIMKSPRNAKRCRDLLTVASSLYDFATKQMEAGSEAYKYFLRKVYFCVTQSLAFYTKDAMPISSYSTLSFFPMDSTLFRGSMRYKIWLANFSPRIYTGLYRRYLLLTHLVKNV